ncbi:MAG: serine/threonine protein kinase [Gemmatimonadota bacterium]|nr:MAG: serine/threonine protein kinase [Gemmatimonadota bacterium]
MDELFHRFKTAVAGRYAVEEEIGRGGMAVVYLAHDRKHDRDVAVKCLLPDLAATLGSDRFLREIRVTANLQHPHILPLYDSGEVDGLLYYVMPYIDGESLRQRLNRDRRLEIDEVVRITVQVASALDYAHRHGVLHRDIKPENIMISEGHAIVADFGIAKAVVTAGGENLTRSGFPLGTPGYMSPEQAASAASLDVRTDVYSLACVVYEMLVGDTPDEWPTEEAVRLGRLTDAPLEHREQLDKLPGRLEQVITKGLATRRNDRYATPNRFSDALAASSERSTKLSDAEVRQIMMRAAELDVEQQAEETQLSIGAVEQAAAEVGIPPERVREAAVELAGPSGGAAAGATAHAPRFFDRSSQLVVDRLIEGEVPAAEYPLLVKEIHARLATVGHASAFGSTLTWTTTGSAGASRNMQVTVSAEAGVTRIHIEENMQIVGPRQFVTILGVAAGGLLGAMFAMAAGLGESPLLILPTLALAAAGATAAVRSQVLSLAKRRLPELQALGDRLAALGKELLRSDHATG